MDHHFVPNLTFGPLLCQQIKQAFPEFHLDVHLMTYQLDSLVDEFLVSGANTITFHTKAAGNPLTLGQRIKDAGVKFGIALNPDEDIASLEPYWEMMDHLLVMGVYPGFAGQKFIPSTYQQIERVLQECQERHLNITVQLDGGVDEVSLPQLVAQGLQHFVVGSRLFRDGKITENYKTLMAAGTR